MTDFIRQIRPANDKCLPFHVDNLFLIFVIIGCQKDCFVGLPPTTIPKYLNGICIVLQFKTCEYLIKAFLSTPKAPILLLWKLTLSPEAISKHLSILLMTKTFWQFASHINKVSSANYRRLTLTLFFPTFIPVYKFSLTTWFTIPDRPCATIKNKKGAIEFLCLNPLVGLNCLVELPFTRTKIMADSKIIAPLLSVTNLTQPSCSILLPKSSFFQQKYLNPLLPCWWVSMHLN